MGTPNVGEMVAGRELDALVAAKLMGWVGIDMVAPTGSIIAPPPPLGIHSVHGYRTIPRYSTDVGLAWQIVEQLHATGWAFALQTHDPMQPKARWRASFDNGEAMNDAYAATPALAICRAALYAVGAQ